MKTMSFIILLALTFLTFSQANAQYMLPKLGYGVDFGIARGDNQGADENFSTIGRGNLQIRVIQPILAQVSLGFAQLKATGDHAYTAQPILIDGRMLFAPIRMEQMFPFLYLGLGIAKDMSGNNGDFMPFVPIGLGIQTKIGPQLMLKGNVGYNLMFSDNLDKRVRLDDDTNRFTNAKNDGFSEIMIGLVYTGPDSIMEPK